MTAEQLDNLPDAALLEKVRWGVGENAKRLAASVLLERYHKQVFRWCLAQLEDRERALDIAQEVLISAYRNLDSFGGRSRFSSWLFAIARNRCISELRRPGLLRDETGAAERLVDEQEVPEMILERKQGEERVKDLLCRHLTSQEQEALWLRSQERMPIEEITRTLGLKGNTGARGVLQSARRKLRSVLERNPRVREELGDG